MNHNQYFYNNWRADDEEEKESFVMRGVNAIDAPILRLLKKSPKAFVGIGVGLVVAAFALVPFLGGEFMPNLEEGNLWVRSTLPSSISFRDASAVATTDSLGRGFKVVE